MTPDEIEKAVDPQLFGEWTIDPTDADSLQQMGKVKMIFASNNVLRYITEEKKKIQILNLTYWVENGCIVTLQPTNLKYESTKYRIDGTVLVLESEGIKSKFIRVAEPI